MPASAKRCGWCWCIPLFLGLGCAPGPAVPPPVVLISIDSLRADHVSAYGYARQTPNIDALARSGVLFEDAHASAPWTLPSHMSIFTGRFASSHRVEEDDESLRSDIDLLAEAFSRAGYRTGGFVAHHYLNADFGFARGFDAYALDQYKVDPSRAHENVRGGAVVERALRWLGGSDEPARPFFLFVHLFDAHYPYRAPRAFRGRYASPDYTGRVDGSPGSIQANLRSWMAPADLAHLIDLYDEEIAFVDHLVGRIVRGVRAAPGGARAVILLTADHGEEFKEHGALGHATTLYREQSHVPLIITEPSMPHAGTRVQATVRHIDIAPTLCEIAGMDASDPFVANLPGVSLLRHLEGTAATEPLPVIFETTRWGPRRSAVAIDGRKAISPMTYQWYWGRRGAEGSFTEPWVRGLERYDLRADPKEERALARARDDRALSSLRAWREATWRGVSMSLRVEPGWQGEVRLAPMARFADEPRLDDGERLYPVDVVKGVISLSDLPARRLSLLLPVDPRTAGAIELRSVRGEISIHDGAGWHSISAGASGRVNLARRAGDEPPGPLLAEGSSARFRARPLARGARVVIDDRTRALLAELGYGTAE